MLFRSKKQAAIQPFQDILRPKINNLHNVNQPPFCVANSNRMQRHLWSSLRYLAPPLQYLFYRLILTFVHLKIRNNCKLGRSPFIIIHFTCKLLRIIALNSSIILISSYNTLIASSPQQRNQQNERQNSNYFFPNLVQLRKLLGLVDPLKTAKKEAAAAGLHCPRPKFRQKFPIL